jgi:hypothetical protein
MFEITGTALATNLDGRLELLATVNRDGHPDAVWHRYERLEGYWTDWQSLGAPGGGAQPFAPTVTQNHLGCLEVAVVSDDRTVWHAGQRHPGRQWTDWQSLETPGEDGDYSASTPALTRNHDGRLELFVGARDGKVWHRWQTKAAGGPWSPWSSLGTPSDIGVRQVAAAQNHDGRLELFVLDWNGTVWHRWQPKAGAGPWSPWSALGTPEQFMALIFAPTVGRNQDGRLELFMRGETPEHGVWHRWQTKAGAGPWSPWSPLGRPEGEFGQIAVGAHADGRLILVASLEATGGVAVSRTGQTAPNDGWSGWAPFETDPGPDTTRDPTLALDAEGRLQAFLQIPHTVEVYWLRQTGPNGGEWRGHWLDVNPPPE